MKSSASKSKIPPRAVQAKKFRSPCAVESKPTVVFKRAGDSSLFFITINIISGIVTRVIITKKYHHHYPLFHHHYHHWVNSRSTVVFKRSSDSSLNVAILPSMQRNARSTPDAPHTTTYMHQTPLQMHCALFSVFPFVLLSELKCIKIQFTVLSSHSIQNRVQKYS